MDNQEFELILENFRDLKTDVRTIKETMITESKCIDNQKNCKFVKKNEFALKLTKIIISGLVLIITVVGTYLKVKGS